MGVHKQRWRARGREKRRTNWRGLLLSVRAFKNKPNEIKRRIENYTHHSPSPFRRRR